MKLPTLIGPGAASLAAPMAPSTSVCENACMNEGNLAYLDCISSGQRSAACNARRLMAYRTCVFRACMSFWERWTTDKEEIPDPWAS